MSYVSVEFLVVHNEADPLITKRCQARLTIIDLRSADLRINIVMSSSSASSAAIATITTVYEADDAAKNDDI